MNPPDAKGGALSSGAVAHPTGAVTTPVASRRLLQHRRAGVFALELFQAAMPRFDAERKSRDDLNAAAWKKQADLPSASFALQPN